MSRQNIPYKPVHKYWQLTVEGNLLRFYRSRPSRFGTSQ
jgi:hypothetical protein